MSILDVPYGPKYDSNILRLSIPSLTAEVIAFQPAFTCSRYEKEMYEICSKLTIKTTEQRQWRSAGVFIANFEKYSTYCSGVPNIDFEQVDTNRDGFFFLVRKIGFLLATMKNLWILLACCW